MSQTTEKWFCVGFEKLRTFHVSKVTIGEDNVNCYKSNVWSAEKVTAAGIKPTSSNPLFLLSRTFHVTVKFSVNLHTLRRFNFIFLLPRHFASNSSPVFRNFPVLTYTTNITFLGVLLFSFTNPFSEFTINFLYVILIPLLFRFSKLSFLLFILYSFFCHFFSPRLTTNFQWFNITSHNVWCFGSNSTWLLPSSALYSLIYKTTIVFSFNVIHKHFQWLFYLIVTLYLCCFTFNSSSVFLSSAFH